MPTRLRGPAWAWATKATGPPTRRASLGPWQSDSLAQLLGTPRGTIQGVHAGATTAVTFLKFMDIAYRAFAAMPFHFLGLMWVDDTIVILERGDARPTQGVLLDRTYYQGILRVDIPDRKIQHGSMADPGRYAHLRRRPWPGM